MLYYLYIIILKYYNIQAGIAPPPHRWGRGRILAAMLLLHFGDLCLWVTFLSVCLAASKPAVVPGQGILLFIIARLLLHLGLG